MNCYCSTLQVQSLSFIHFFIRFICFYQSKGLHQQSHVLFLELEIGLQAFILLAMGDFILEWLQNLTSLTFQQLSFFQGLKISRFFSLTLKPIMLVISRASSTSFSRLIFLFLFVSCTIFPYYVTVSASNLLAVESYESALTAVSFFAFLFTFNEDAIFSLIHAFVQ